LRRSPVAAVIGAIVTTLKSSTGVTGLATGGVYNHVPQGTSYPYVVVSSPTGRRQDTFGRFGGETLIDIKAVSQYQGDRDAANILDHCGRALDLQPLATTQHTTLGIAWETDDRFAEVVNGLVTRHHVATYRVWTEQSSS
jgi:hypothetical protein